MRSVEWRKPIFMIIFIISFIPILLILYNSHVSMEYGSCFGFGCNYGKKAFWDELIFWSFIMSPILVPCLGYQIVYIIGIRGKTSNSRLTLIMKKMEEIKYTDNTDDSDFSKNYRLKSPEEVINDKNGVCWDQVELERFYFEKDSISCNSYFIVEYDNKEFPTHTFMVVKDENNFYWFEHSWEPYRGIHVYKNLKDLLCDVKKKFCKNRDMNRTFIYQYEKPQYGISGKEFFEHCENGIKIDL